MQIKSNNGSAGNTPVLALPIRKTNHRKGEIRWITIMVIQINL